MIKEPSQEERVFAYLKDRLGEEVALSELAVLLFGLTSANATHVQLVGASARSLRAARKVRHGCAATSGRSKYDGYDLILVKSRATRGHRPPVVAVKLVEKVEAVVEEAPAEIEEQARPVTEVFDVYGATAEVTKYYRHVAVSIGRSLRFVGVEGRLMNLLVRSENLALTQAEVRQAGLNSIAIQKAAKAAAQRLVRHSCSFRLETSPAGNVLALCSCRDDKSKVDYYTRFVASLRFAAQPVPA